MTQRLDCPPAPGPLEEYAVQFDDLFGSLAQRRGFRAYLHGLLLPRDRNKTLTALANAEPIVGAQAAAVQQLQFFVSEAAWDATTITQRRLALLQTAPATAPHPQGVLILDDTGDRKEGKKTAHVARQYLGSVGKTDNGIVAVSSLWADERVYYPLHVQPSTPASRLARGKKDPSFRTKPQIAVELVQAAMSADVPFRAVVADCLYGDNPTFEGALQTAGLPYVLGMTPSRGIWAPVDAAHTPQEAAQELRWGGTDDPGDWAKVERTFRDGHTEIWWAADLRFGSYGPDKALRVIVATTDPTTLPDLTTWYLSTNLARPGSAAAETSPFPPAELAEVVQLYGLRNWVEQGYKVVKQELGWADFMVRADRAIRRHWELVWCAFCFCWRHWFSGPCFQATHPNHGNAADPTANSEPPTLPLDNLADESAGRGKNRRVTRTTVVSQRCPGAPLVAGGLTARAELVESLDLPAALVACLVRGAPTARRPDASRLGR
jgi:SRSO17 transposase